MNKLPLIAASLGLKAEAAEQTVEQLIGTPGPGIDIIFLPELPVAHWYSIKCMTIAGAKFIQLLYNGQGRVSSTDLTAMKRRLAEFGLSFHTEWSNVVEIVP